MCGIMGELQFQTSVAPTGNFDQLIELMTRRGPDDHGFWSDDLYCRLGFRRLAVIDLSRDANQPMVIDGRFALVFNGELYNFRELRSELESQGVNFKTAGDAEVVLQALIRWGKDALNRFNGMFALGFYDVHEQSLLLARDPVGIKPLYALISRDGVVFASQYDQILAHPWSERRQVSTEALGLYLRLGYIPAPYALLEHTLMIEPGCWLEATAGGRLRKGRYFRFPVYQQADLQGDEAYEAVDAAVTSAVRRQMVSDVPLGTFLSGGIDSPLVAAKAVAAGNGQLKAFTIGNGDNTLDETDAAGNYARELGLNHLIEDYTADKALTWLDKVIDACNEPLADYSIFPTMLVSCLARRDVTVMLSGDGGDELFWGYTQRFGPVLDLATSFRSPRWWRAGRRGISRLSRSENGHQVPGWPTIGDWYRGIHSRISDRTLANMFTTIPAWPEEFDLFRYSGWKQDDTAQWLRWNELTGHLTRVLLKVDRASMYHSLEVRVPLLDREVLDVAARVDWQSCLDLAGRTGKKPLRSALARHVDFQSMDKLGFSVPMDEWLRGPLVPVFRDVVLGRMEIVGLPIRRANLENYFNEHVEGQADHSRWLWTLLFLALWSDRYLER